MSALPTSSDATSLLAGGQYPPYGELQKDASLFRLQAGCLHHNALVEAHFIRPVLAAFADNLSCVRYCVVVVVGMGVIRVGCCNPFAIPPSLGLFWK